MPTKRHSMGADHRQAEEVENREIWTLSNGGLVWGTLEAVA